MRHHRLNQHTHPDLDPCDVQKLAEYLLAESGFAIKSVSHPGAKKSISDISMFGVGEPETSSHKKIIL